MAGESVSIVPPIVVAEGRDVSLYRSETDVLRDLEPWYPSSADYRAFDSEGRRLELVADPPVRARRLLGPLWTDDAHESTLFLRPAEAEPSGAGELAVLLREWLPSVGGAREAVARLTLDELLREAVERAGFAL